MSFVTRGTIAFVTGANRGIGRALVQALLDRGASKVYAGARKPETLAALAAASGGRVVPVKLDVTRPFEVQAAAAQAPDVTLVVNNAGVVSQFGGAFTDKVWLTAAREEYEVNVLGPLAVSQAFAPILAKNGGGALVNVSSVAGLVALDVLTSYSASKAALHSVTQATRKALKGTGHLTSPASTPGRSTPTWPRTSTGRRRRRPRRRRHPRRPRSGRRGDLPGSDVARVRVAVPQQPEGARAPVRRAGARRGMTPRVPGCQGAGLLVQACWPRTWHSLHPAFARGTLAPCLLSVVLASPPCLGCPRGHNREVRCKSGAVPPL